MTKLQQQKAAAAAACSPAHVLAAEGSRGTRISHLSGELRAEFHSTMAAHKLTGAQTAVRLASGCKSQEFAEANAYHGV